MIVTLYSKRGCHLCEEVRSLLDELAPERGFAVAEIDIETDPTLFARYRYEIPVVIVDGRAISTGKIDERKLLSALAVQQRD